MVARTEKEGEKGKHIKAKSCFLMPLSQQKKPVPLREMVDSRNGAYKMDLEHPVGPESKEALRKKKPKTHNETGMLKGHRSQLKELPMTEAKTIRASK